MLLETDPKTRKQAHRLALKVVKNVVIDEMIKRKSKPELSLSEERLDDGTVIVKVGGGIKIERCEGCE